jgi:hypothetical protein
MRRSALIPCLIACFVALVWLNQGTRHADSQARAEAIAQEMKTPLDGVRYVLLLLYMRSGDEEIYHAVASAMRGLPYDHARLLDRGIESGAGFDRAPPEDGHWHRPYVEVPSEYPVAILPFMLLPGLVAGTDFELYGRVFSVLMGVLLLAAGALAIRAQPARDVRERWVAMGWLLLALGSLVVQRLDAVPAFFLALAVWAAAERKHATLGFALGFATATKFLPLLLVAPIVAADREAWATVRARKRALVAFGVTVVVGFAPMLFPPDALFGVLRYHAARGLHIESTWGALLGAWQLLAGTAVRPAMSFGSVNMAGPAAAFFARISAPVTLVLIAAITALFARAPAPADDVARRDRIALAMLAGLLALWTSAKVFSPTWGLPLVLAVSGRLGKELTWIFFAVALATQICLCGIYVYVVSLTPIGQTALLVRLALLLAFATVALRGIFSLTARPENASPTVTA